MLIAFLVVPVRAHVSGHVKQRRAMRYLYLESTARFVKNDTAVLSLSIDLFWSILDDQTGTLIKYKGSLGQ